MPEANKLLRCARESVESPNASGEPLTRQELAELVNAWVYENTGSTNVAEIDDNYIGKLEQGKIRWPQHEHRRAALRAMLGVETDSELGFRRPRREHRQGAGVAKQQVSGVLESDATAVDGECGIDTFAFTEPTPVPSTVGTREVWEVRAAARAFAGWDARYGGGFVREAVMAQLRYAVQLLNAQCSEQTRADLLSAVGYLGHVTGFMAFDAYAHATQSKPHCWELGLWKLRRRSSPVGRLMTCGC